MKRLSIAILLALALLLTTTVFAAPAPDFSFGAATLDFSTSAASSLANSIAFTGTVGLGKGFGISVATDPDTQVNISYKFGTLGDTPLKLLAFAGIQSQYGFWLNSNSNFGVQFGLQLDIPINDSWQAYAMANIGTPVYKFNAGAAYSFNEKIALHADINYASGWKSTDVNVWYPSVGIGVKL